VFMTGHLHVVPMALLHNLRHNKVLHEQVVLMTARARDVPHVPAVQRVTVEKLSKGFYRVMVSHGFMDEPDIPGSLELCRTHGLSADPQVTSFFLCRETLVPSPRPEMNPFEERLFILLSAGNQPATAYFGIPPDQVVELGIQIEV
jgi:KUP system potassium uptake protein